MPRQHPIQRPIALATQLALLSLAAQSLQSAHAQSATPALQPVDVVGTAPLPGQGVNRDDLPYSTQVLRRQQLDAAQADNLSDHLARRLPGVQVSDVQGSPFQGDVSYRGYHASGLLGAAQGLSVYLDGVRVNEPFGDVVNWDMIPEFALDSVSLIPSANPAFGLNSLGGALALRTASGRSAPGLKLEGSVGSFWRQKLAASHGGATEDGWQHYLSASGFTEDGWRDHSSGHLGHVLAKVSKSTDDDEFSLSLLHGQSRLVGNGLVPLYSLEEDGQRSPDLGAQHRSAIYTYPDETRNRLTQLSAQWQHDLDAHTSLNSLLWQRHAKRNTTNGDVSDASDAGDSEPLSTEDNASLNHSRTQQRGQGLSLGLTGRQPAHQWQAGVSLEYARVSYQQSEQSGFFDATRSVQSAADAQEEPSARVSGTSRHLGLYASDTWALNPRTHLSAALRLNHSRVNNQLSSADEASGELLAQAPETFHYRSLNPALGLAYKLEAGATLFANIARNTRVPTVIELGCANPEAPCRLPAGLQSDPYLKQVRATTTEAGWRFGAPASQALRGSVAVYRSENHDDILFRSLSASGQLGYFQNFARTRHQGLDAELAQRWGAWDASLSYSYLRATYEAEGWLRMGERNVQIRPGTQMAGLPRQSLKLALDWQATPSWLLGLDVQAFSSRGVAGNEDGLLEDGATQTQRLRLPGYGLLNLRTSWKPEQNPGLELFAKVNNVLDKTYANFAALADTVFDAQGQWTGESRNAVFVAPGAPRAFSLGARVRF